MKVLIAGDFCQDYRVDQLVRSEQFNFFDAIKPTVQGSDYSIVNFEFPVVVNESQAQPIPKYGPCLRGTEGGIRAVRYSGFKCCTLANNHSLDQGGQCLLDTIELMSKNNLDIVGAGRNLKEASQTLFRKIGEETLAVINCCEHEFTIATENTTGANPLNPVHQYYKIKEAKSKADYVLVIVHGGHEHYQLPSSRMQDTYRFFIDAGADAVVNHHQHCFSGYEMYKGRPIFYGLGNLLFDDPVMHSNTWNEGYMAQINFCSDKCTFSIIPYIQCAGAVGIELLDETEMNLFQRRLDELNAIISDRQQLILNNSKYYQNSSYWELTVLEPYRSRIANKLYSWHLLPKCVKKKKLAAMFDHISCESHRDKLLFALRHDDKNTLKMNNQII